MTNALNPKAGLFFIALFATVVSAMPPSCPGDLRHMDVVSHPRLVSLVAVTFTCPVVRARFLRYGHWIDRALGLVFVGFAISLAVVRLR